MIRYPLCAFLEEDKISNDPKVDLKELFQKDNRVTGVMEAEL